MINSNDSDLLRRIDKNVGEMHVQLFHPQTGFIPETKTLLANHNTRVGRLEKFAWLTIGGGIVIIWIIAHHLLSVQALALQVVK